MGCSYSCSSMNCLSIDDSMNNLIFMPPSTPKTYFEQHMNKPNETLAFIESSNGHNICLMHLWPSSPNRWNKTSTDINKYIIYCHGNGADVTQIYYYLRKMCDYLKVGIIALDYQGYGLSEGNPSENGCYHDLENTIKYVQTQLDIRDENIFLFGRSLGTGVVIEYVSKYNWKTPIILVSPYKTISKVIVDTSCVNSLKKPIDKFRSEDKMNSVDCPVKIFHGKRDKLINISHGETLYSLLKDKRLDPVWIDNADHNDILDLINLRDVSEVINYKLFLY